MKKQINGNQANMHNNHVSKKILISHPSDLLLILSVKLNF